MQKSSKPSKDASSPSAQCWAGRMRLLRRFAPASVLDAGERKDLRLQG